MKYNQSIMWENNKSSDEMSRTKFGLPQGCRGQANFLLGSFACDRTKWLILSIFVWSPDKSHCNLAIVLFGWREKCRNSQRNPFMISPCGE